MRYLTEECESESTPESRLFYRQYKALHKDLYWHIVYCLHWALWDRVFPADGGTEKVLLAEDIENELGLT